MFIYHQSRYVELIDHDFFLKNLSVNFRAVAAALDDPEFPVRVNAALALTELVLAHDSGQ